MSKLTEQLRTIRIFNAHDFAGYGNVYISYCPQLLGRGGRSAHWGVYRAGYQTDRNAPWYDYGNKVFTVWGRQDKAAKLEEAKAWASKKYKIKEWAKTPFGDYMDAKVVAARLNVLERALERKQHGT